MFIPDDETGKEMPILLRVFLVNFSADWLAAQSLGPNQESKSATHPCSQCRWVSFEHSRRKVGKKHRLLGETCAELRGHDDQKQIIRRFREEVVGQLKTAVHDLLSAAHSRKEF